MLGKFLATWPIAARSTRSLMSRRLRTIALLLSACGLAAGVSRTPALALRRPVVHARRALPTRLCAEDDGPKAGKAKIAAEKRLEAERLALRAERAAWPRTSPSVRHPR